MNVLEAVTGFLRKVRELDTYGIQLYDMRYEDSPCQLGITPGGIAIFRRNRRIGFHDWEIVAEVSFKNKKLLVVLTPAGVCVHVAIGIMESASIQGELYQGSILLGQSWSLQDLYYCSPTNILTGHGPIGSV